MTREASPPEWDRLTPHEQTTMFRGKGREPSNRPNNLKGPTKYTQRTPTQPNSTQQDLQKPKERTGAATKRRGAATGRGCRVKRRENEEEQRAKGTDETRG